MTNNALQKHLEYEKMEKKHKETLFEIKKEFASKKIDLLKKEHNEKFDLCIAKTEEIQKNGYSPELEKKYLEKKLALHEKNMQECLALFEQKHQKMKAWFEKNKQERDAFKKGL